MREAFEIERRQPSGESLSGWRITGAVVGGLIVYFLIGVVARLLFLTWDHFGTENTFIGTLLRELAVNFIGALFAAVIVRKHLNAASFQLYGIIFAVLTAGTLFGVTIVFLSMPGIQFSFFDAAWYVSAGVGAVAGVWQGVHEK